MSNGPTTDKMEVERITRSPDEIKATRQELAISTRTGVLMPTDLAQALEFAQNMAKADTAVPKHLRGSPGACLAILEYAGSWEMAPYGVANKSYVVNDRLCFEAQLIHAVIKKRADLKFPKLGLETRYEGDIQDGTLKVTVFAECYIDDERTVTRVLELESPMLKDIKPQNSPLWKSDPKQQIFYRTTMMWQRRHKPEILLGIYTRDEMQDMTDEERAALAEDRGTVEDVSRRASGLAARLLPGTFGQGEGFHPENENGIKGQDRPRPILDSKEIDEVAPDVEGAVAAPASNVWCTQCGRDYVTEPEQCDGCGGKMFATVPPKQAEPTQAAPAADPKPVDPVDPTPAKPPAQEKKPDPTNDEEYQAHLSAWLGRATDDAWIHDHYKEEKPLRTKCMADIAACNAMKNNRLKEIGSA